MWILVHHVLAAGLPDGLRCPIVASSCCGFRFATISAFEISTAAVSQTVLGVAFGSAFGTTFAFGTALDAALVTKILGPW